MHCIYKRKFIENQYTYHDKIIEELFFSCGNFPMEKNQNDAFKKNQFILILIELLNACKFRFVTIWKIFYWF